MENEGTKEGRKCPACDAELTERNIDLLELARTACGTLQSIAEKRGEPPTEAFSDFTRMLYALLVMASPGEPADGEGGGP